MEHNSKKKIIIIGAGLIGLSLGKILSKKKYRIIFIERSNHIGGFLQSIKIKNQLFDFGTHFLKKTGNKLLDKSLFNKIERDWIKLPHLNSGSIYKKKINDQNQFINLDENKNKKKIISQILKKKIIKKKINNEYDNCISLYGSILTKEIERIIKKYTAIKLNRLPIGFVSKFGLGRFTLNCEDELNNLKKSKKLDQIFAYKFNTQGLSKKYSFYPRVGGIGQYVNYFGNYKKTIYFNTKLEKINCKKRQVISIKTSAGILKCDYLINTISDILSLKNIFWEFVNITTKKRFNCDNDYINIHNPASNFYRMTFYDNIQKKRCNKRLTIEIIRPKRHASSRKYIEKELKKFGIIKNNEDINIISQTTIPLKIPKIQNKKRGYNFKNYFHIVSGLFEQKNQEDSLLKAFQISKRIL